MSYPHATEGGTPAPPLVRSESHPALESRALGRPKETVEHQGEDNPLRDELLRIPQEERRAWLRRLNGVDEAAAASSRHPFTVGKGEP